MMADVVAGSEGFRVFVNLGTWACASGCRYCYVPPGVSAPLGWEEIEMALSRFLQSDGFVAGRGGTVLTFGGHTDLFRSAALFELLVRALPRLCALGNPIQISTKQYISAEWISAVAACERYSGQIALFVSCATISDASTLERGADSPTRRWQTFANLRAAGLRCALLIKPWLEATTVRDLPQFADVAAEFALDAVCLGALHATPRIAARLGLPFEAAPPDGRPTHPLIAEPHRLVAPASRVVAQFHASLGPIPLYESTLCVSAAFAQVPCPLHPVSGVCQTEPAR